MVAMTTNQQKFGWAKSLPVGAVVTRKNCRIEFKEGIY